MWHNAGQLPSVVRFLVRDLTTGRTLAVSSATMVHVELPADCAGGTSQACGSQSAPAANAPGAPADAGPGPKANATRDF
jgi:general secretion pathway protein J